MGENIYTLPSDMNLKIKTGTVGYNNKILVSDEKFSLGKNDKVNAPAMKSRQRADSNEVLANAPTITYKTQEPHNKEKLPLYFFWQVVLQDGIRFNETQLSLQ